MGWSSAVRRPLPCRLCRRCSAAGISIELVLCQPDRPSGRGLALTVPPVKRAALDAGIEVLQPEKIRNNTELQARLEAIGRMRSSWSPMAG